MDNRVVIPLSDNKSGLRNSFRQSNVTKEKPPGHSVILASLIKHRAEVKLKLLSGESVEGTITQMDKWTITIRPKGESYPETFFKHGLQSFTRV